MLCLCNHAVETVQTHGINEGGDSGRPDLVIINKTIHTLVCRYFYCKRNQNSSVTINACLVQTFANLSSESILFMNVLRSCACPVITTKLLSLRVTFLSFHQSLTCNVNPSIHIVKELSVPFPVKKL